MLRHSQILMFVIGLSLAVTVKCQPSEDLEALRRNAQTLEREFKNTDPTVFSSVRELKLLPADAARVLPRVMAEWGDPWSTGDVILGPTKRHVISWVSPNFLVVVYEDTIALVGAPFFRVALSNRRSAYCNYRLGWALPADFNVSHFQGLLNAQKTGDSPLVCSPAALKTVERPQEN